MYQSIDDEDEYDLPRSGWMLPTLAALILLLLGATLIWLLRPDMRPAERTPSPSEPATIEAYRQALSETRPALRRARLRDFVNQNPVDARADAARAQLSVLDAAETADWQATVSAVYAPRAEKEARLAAIDQFQTRWGGFLGGRDADVAELRAVFAGEPDPAERPDRSLPDAPSPIPTTVPADTLAGGPVIAPLPPPVIAPTVPVSPPVVAPARAAKVTPVRVRRNVTPRYPRSAQRRKIDAVVTLRLDIDAKGRVDLAELVSVETERYADEFVKASERAAMRTRFHPKTIDGEPVEALGVLKRYRFQSGR